MSRCRISIPAAFQLPFIILAAMLLVCSAGLGYWLLRRYRSGAFGSFESFDKYNEGAATGPMQVCTGVSFLQHYHPCCPLEAEGFVESAIAHACQDWATGLSGFIDCVLSKADLSNVLAKKKDDMRSVSQSS
jgi:hypothetical protein